MNTEALLLQWLDATRPEDGDDYAWLREWLRQQMAAEAVEPRQRATRRARRLRRQLRASRHFIEALAELLGACPRCFGQHPRCPACGGEGAPGFRPPDPALAEWIAPALHRLGYRLLADEAPTHGAEPIWNEER